MSHHHAPDAKPPVTDAERRRFARHDLRATARLEPLGGDPHLDEIFHVALQNIACTGVMFHAPQPLHPGSAWRMTFFRQDQRIGAVPLAIRYCQPTLTGYHIGAQFIIDPAILQGLGVTAGDDDVDTAWDVSAMFEQR